MEKKPNAMDKTCSSMKQIILRIMYSARHLENSYYYTSIGRTCIVYAYTIDNSTDRNAIL